MAQVLSDTLTVKPRQMFDVPGWAVELCAACMEEARERIPDEVPCAEVVFDATRCDQCGYRPKEITYQVRFTAAPEDYDGFGTYTLEPTNRQGWRKVAIDPDSLTWQQDRYHSGMYGCMTPADFAKVYA